MPQKAMPISKAITLDLAYPPSANRLWRTSKGHQYVPDEVKRWKRSVAWIAKLSGATLISGDVFVLIVFHPRITKKGLASKIRLDSDNTRKALFDALNGVTWHDDKQVTRDVFYIGEPKIDGGLTVTITPVDEIQSVWEKVIELLESFE